MNNNRDYLVFEDVYYGLLNKYHSFISDIRLKGLSIRNLKVIDSSTIQLFSDILRGVGNEEVFREYDHSDKASLNELCGIAWIYKRHVQSMEKNT